MTSQDLQYDDDFSANNQSEQYQISQQNENDEYDEYSDTFEVNRTTEDD